jgi:predicted HicB family RNase H-like nuclease
VPKWLTFELDDELHRRAKAEAALRGLGLYAYLEAKIAEGVERDEQARRGE